jgi:hypothetical protein
MAIQSVIQKPKYERKRGASLLDKAAAAANFVGTAATAIYGSGLTAGAAGAALPSAYSKAKQTFANKGYTQQVSPGARPEVMSAMDRRVQYQQQDPMQQLEDARMALAESDFDPETKRRLEAPILRALKSQGGMA